MANTLNLGNSKWATKDGSLLGYNSENDNFKPLPFTTTRASASSRVNKLGLIENVTNNIATIDYQGNVNGALLTQPQSTNLITYPISFGNSYWTKSGATVQGDITNVIGSNVVVNGDFASASGWNLQGTWTIGGGTANNTGVSDGQVFRSGTEVGKVYKCTVTVSAYSSGEIKFVLGSTASANFTGNGTHTYIVNSALNTNLGIQSTSFIGSIDNFTIEEIGGFTSPSADYTTSAYKLVEDTSTGSHSIKKVNSPITNSFYSGKIFVKAAGSTKVSFSESGATGAYLSIDLSDGSVLASNLLSSYSINSLSNGWFEVNITPSTSIVRFDFAVFLLDASYTTGTPAGYSYTGDGTSGVYIYGAQLEALSYPTSLIYNGVEGSTVTRVGDLVSQSGLSNIINSTEGVLYAEIAALADDVSTDQRSIQIEGLNGSGNNEIIIQYLSGNLRFLVYGNSTLQLNTSQSVSLSSYTKVALLYKNDVFKIYINGTEIYNVSGSYTMPTNLNKINFSRSGASIFYGNCKDTRVYNEALSDAELIALTS